MRTKKRQQRRSFPLFHRDVHATTRDLHRFGVVVPRSFTTLG